MGRFKFTLLAALVAALVIVPSASAQLEFYPSTANGGTNEFVFGKQNTVGLRGTLTNTSGEYLRIRGYDASAACPSLATDVPAPYSADLYVNPANPVDVPNVLSGAFTQYRDTRFCVYEYFTGGANDEFNPEGRFDQVVHFREPVSSLDWLYVASSESPDPPYLVETGKSEAPLGRAVAFVPQSQQCPPSYPGGAGAMSFGGTTDPTFTDFGEVNVPVGFWRACGYLINGSTSSLGAQSTFSQAPKGGWKPKYSLAKGSLKVKSGKLALGSASCPAACTITMVAKSGKTTLAKGTASGNGKIKLKLKATSAGRKAAKKGVKAKFTLTSMIELSEVTQTATLKLK